MRSLHHVFVLLISCLISQYSCNIYGALMMLSTDGNKPITPENQDVDVIFIPTKETLSNLISNNNFDSYERVAILKAVKMNLHDIQISKNNYPFLMGKNDQMNKLMWPSSINMGLQDIYDVFNSTVPFSTYVVKDDPRYLYESTDKVQIIRIKSDINRAVEEIYNHYNAENKKILIIVFTDTYQTGRSYKFSSLYLRSDINKVVKKSSTFSSPYVDIKNAYNVDHSGIVNTGTLATFEQCLMFFYSKFTLTAHNDSNHVCYLSSVPVSLSGSKCGSLLRINFDSDNRCNARNVVFEMKLSNNSLGWKCENANFKFDYKQEKVQANTSCPRIEAPYTFSFTCNQQIFKFNDTKENQYTAVINYFQIQNSHVTSSMFNPAVDCNNIFTIEILNGFVATIIFVIIIAWGISMILNIKSYDIDRQPSEMIELGTN